MLDTPLTLRSGLVLPNRLAKAAMTEDLADPVRGDPNERHVVLYRRWAEGGVGLQITGNVMLDRRFLEHTGNIVLDERTDVATFARVASACAVGGGVALVQLNHPGRQTTRFVSASPVAPSEGPPVRVLGSFATPRALTEAEIEGLLARYGACAAAVERAGFAGVQVHAAHGYLQSQFLSPLTNRRTDRWGGSLENRARFLLEAVRAVRAATKPGFTVSVKLNSADFQRGGFSDDDSAAVAGMLEAEGLDLLEISGGNYESMALLGLADAQQTSTTAREAYFLTYAERIRSAVKTPLMLTGGLRSRDVMEAVVRDGVVDVVGLARPLALDPALPRKLLAGATPRSEATTQRVGVRALDPMAEAGWYAHQLALLGDGHEPDPRYGRWRAVASYLTREALGGLRRWWAGPQV